MSASFRTPPLAVGSKFLIEMKPISPYRITQATLTTYSGKKVTVELETEFFSKPLRVVKEILLDSFVKMCKSSTDPFVKIECKPQPLFQP